MAKIPGFHCQGPGLVPGQGTEIPQASWYSKKKEYVNSYISMIARISLMVKSLLLF